jgi:thiamine monophosphate synthase
VQGLEALAAVCREVSLPVVAIGGLTPAHAPAVRDAGATGLAAISAVLQAERPAVEARRIQQAFAVI